MPIFSKRLRSLWVQKVLSNYRSSSSFKYLLKKYWAYYLSAKATQTICRIPKAADRNTVQSSNSSLFFLLKCKFFHFITDIHLRRNFFKGVIRIFRHERLFKFFFKNLLSIFREWLNLLLLFVNPYKEEMKDKLLKIWCDVVARGWDTHGLPSCI